MDANDNYRRARRALGDPPFDPVVVIEWVQRASEVADQEFRADPDWISSEGCGSAACELQDAEYALRRLLDVW